MLNTWMSNQNTADFFCKYIQFYPVNLMPSISITLTALSFAIFYKELTIKGKKLIEKENH